MARRRLTDEEYDQAEVALIAWFESQDIEVADAARIMLRVLHYTILCLSKKNQRRCRQLMAEAILEMETS